MGFKKCLVKMLKEQRYQTYEMHGKGNQDIGAKPLTSNGFAIKKYDANAWHTGPKCKRPPKRSFGCGSKGIRTPDPLLVRQML